MIAEVGRGRHYSCDDPQAIPQIFAQETMTAGKSAIKELPFTPVQITATTVLRGIDLDDAPPLLGYVVTQPKPTAHFILATETGDPLLLWWRYGLGQTAAFTSDAKSRWSAEWIDWEHYGQFWTQVVRHAMRQSPQHGVSLDIKTLAEGIRITLDATDETGQYINEAIATATLIHSGLSEAEWTLHQTAPGRYEADISLQRAGGVNSPTRPQESVYHLQTQLRQGEKILWSQSRSVMPHYSDELRIRPTNETLLRQLAESTGGGYDVMADELVRWQTDSTLFTRRALLTYPLWMWLLSFAAVLYVFDVLLRRVEVMP
jgi:hypothetical protein